ncbi:hypothetical protein BBJ28_00021959 [Nothophytophthora sp. Chile5]|nr:hypothetical protein BBJ28_00021959 [Nothophytophthora sp. Chile5]
MALIRRLQARVQRWHQLSRYYVNKWHYDGSKWADRVWYGQGSTGNGPAVASVAFMITRSMRQQLTEAGFPSSAISALQPAAAQKIIADKVSYVQFFKQQKEEEIARAAEAAKRALAQEEEVAKQQEQQSGALVAAVETDTSFRDESPKKEPATSVAALVVQEEAPAPAEGGQKV